LIYFILTISAFIITFIGFVARDYFQHKAKSIEAFKILEGRCNKLDTEIRALLLTSEILKRNYKPQNRNRPNLKIIKDEQGDE